MPVAPAAHVKPSRNVFGSEEPAAASRAMQELSIAPAAPFTESGTNTRALWLQQHLFAASERVTGALRGPRRSSCSVQER